MHFPLHARVCVLRERLADERARLHALCEAVAPRGVGKGEAIDKAVEPWGAGCVGAPLGWGTLSVRIVDGTGVWHG